MQEAIMASEEIERIKENIGGIMHNYFENLDKLC